jgi:hypothetical protein
MARGLRLKKEELKMKNEETFGQFGQIPFHSSFCLFHSAF